MSKVWGVRPTEKLISVSVSKKIDQSKILNKNLQVNHWSRNSLEFQGLLIHWCCHTTFTNHVMPCGNMWLNQLCEAYTRGLTPSEVTN